MERRKVFITDQNDGRRVCPAHLFVGGAPRQLLVHSGHRSFEEGNGSIYVVSARHFCFRQNAPSAQPPLGIFRDRIRQAGVIWCSQKCCFLSQRTAFIPNVTISLSISAIAFHPRDCPPQCSLMSLRSFRGRHSSVRRFI